MGVHGPAECGHASQSVPDRSSVTNGVQSAHKNHHGTGPFDSYIRMILLSVFLINGLHCSGFVQASFFRSYKLMILESAILIRGLHALYYQNITDATVTANCLKLVCSHFSAVRNIVRTVQMFAPHSSQWPSRQVRHGCSASPRPPCDGTPSAYVWPSPRPTPSPSCPYPSDKTPPDATTKPVDAQTARSSHWVSMAPRRIPITRTRVWHPNTGPAGEEKPGQDIAWLRFCRPPRVDR